MDDEYESRLEYLHEEGIKSVVEAAEHFGFIALDVGDALSTGLISGKERVMDEGYSSISEYSEAKRQRETLEGELE